MEFQNPKLKIFDIADFYARAKVLKVRVFIARREYLVEYERLKIEKMEINENWFKSVKGAVKNAIFNMGIKIIYFSKKHQEDSVLE